MFATSNNFELYTNAGEREARQTLETFEQVRDFFMRVKSANTTTRLPVTIVGFRSLKDYKAYTPLGNSAAYYTNDTQRDYIVMGSMGSENTPLAIHEYMHLLVKHSGLKLPPWLNEGFAELYSTLQPQSGQTLLGALPPGRVRSLQDGKWIPLAQLLGVGQDSPEYNEKDRMGMFYAESWALVHMLALSKEYRENFPKLMLLMTQTGDSAEALRGAYGKSVEELEKELKRYLRSPTLTGVLFKARFEKVKIERGRPAGELETALVLAKLTSFAGRNEEAARDLRRLLESHKDNAEVEEALGYLAWRSGQVERARGYLEAAIEHGAANWKTHYDYSLLTQNDVARGEKRSAALRKVLEANPEHVDARLMLGYELYRQKSYGRALVELQKVRKVEPDKAAQLLLVEAYCALQLKMEDQARKYAAEAKKYARTPDQGRNAEQLLTWLERKESAPPALAARVAESEDEPGPSLRRVIRADTTMGTGLRMEPLSVKGKLVKMDCLDPMARLHVASGESRQQFLIRDPGMVVVRSATGGVVEMICGDQNKDVLVEYAPVRDEKLGTVGEVVALEFQ